MKILVIGGKNKDYLKKVNNLCEQNNIVYVINKNKNDESLIDVRAKFLFTDIKNYENINKILKILNIDLIIHCDSLSYIDEKRKYDLDYYKEKFYGMDVLLKAMKNNGCKKILFNSYVKKKEIAIEVKNISKTYNLYENEKDILKEIIIGGKRHKTHQALKNISFTVYKNETFGVLGGNGSGKSTILNIINGTTYPTKGKIKTCGKVSLLNVGSGIVAGYTGRENIYYKCSLMGMDKKEIDRKLESIINFSELGKFIDYKINKYSAGMKAKLGFSIAIHVEPEILIIDEALAVGDSRFAKKCHAKMNELKEKGVTILYVSHSHAAVSSFCTRVCWINNGELIAVGEVGPVTSIYEKFMKNELTIKEAKIQVKELI